MSKNKAVCYRALIQNIYIQMANKKSMNAYQDDMEIASEIIHQLIDNQNLTLRFVVDQLGINPKTGVMASDQSKPVDLEFNGPGSGGSPNHPSSF